MSYNITLDGNGLLTLILSIIPAFFFLFTLQNTLKVIAPHNRRMAPGLIWLMLIPVFNLFWQFVVVIKLANSIQNELDMRRTCAAELTSVPGLAFCILPFFFWVPLLGILLLIGAFICWISYWVRVNKYRKLFISVPYLADADSEIFNGTL